MKHVAITDFLTNEEIAKAVDLHERREATGYAQTVCDLLIRPNIVRINQSLGQENDPMYLAYLVEFVMEKASR